MTADILKLKKEKLALLEKEKEIRAGLPHLYPPHKLYKFQVDFIESINDMNLLTAANQLGKSSCNIIKCIKWATDTKLWPKLWKTHIYGNPNLFWYLYPSRELATIEFETKWSKYLPKGKYKDDPVYGWKAEYEDGYINALKFNSGVTVLFKFYSQKVMNLQGNTVYAVFVDEELPFYLYDEVISRIRGIEGYYNMVFTATEAQEEWRCAVEEKGPKERFKGAFKQQTTLWDCVTYADGSPSPWTPERIIKEENKCGTESEKLRRIYARFILAEGRVFEAFEPGKNVVKPYDIGKDYFIYAGIDLGSGGKNHPSAITLLAVKHDFKKGIVFRGWLGNAPNIQHGDVIDKYKEMTKGLVVSGMFYDFSAVDFGPMALDAGLPAMKADKSSGSREFGIGTVNTLFKNLKLEIFDLPELQPLVNELLSYRVGTPKHRAVDDMIDSLRYQVAKIPWDFSDIDNKSAINVTKIKEKSDVEKRLDFYRNHQEEVREAIDAEIEEANSLY